MLRAVLVLVLASLFRPAPAQPVLVNISDSTVRDIIHFTKVQNNIIFVGKSAGDSAHWEVFDTSLALLRAARVAIPFQPGTIRNQLVRLGNQFSFVNQYVENDSVKLSVNRLNADGNLVDSARTVHGEPYNPGVMGRYVAYNILASENLAYIMGYRITRVRNSDKASLTTFVMDSLFRVQASSLTLPYDTTAQMVGFLEIDSTGVVWYAVMDRFDSYRLGTEIELYRYHPSTGALEKELLKIPKVKLKDVLFRLRHGTLEAFGYYREDNMAPNVSGHFEMWYRPGRPYDIRYFPMAKDQLKKIAYQRSRIPVKEALNDYHILETLYLDGRETMVAVPRVFPFSLNGFSVPGGFPVWGNASTTVSTSYTWTATGNYFSPQLRGGSMPLSARLGMGGMGGRLVTQPVNQPMYLLQRNASGILEPVIPRISVYTQNMNPQHPVVVSNGKTLRMLFNGYHENQPWIRYYELNQPRARAEALPLGNNLQVLSYMNIIQLPQSAIMVTRRTGTNRYALLKL